MKTVQLRRYDLIPEEVEPFLAWFPGIVEVRKKFGFHVEFALLDREANQFTWAVSHDGDFDAVEQTYLTSPERAQAFEGQPTRVAKMHVAKAEIVAGL